MKNKFLSIAFVFAIAVLCTLNINLTKLEDSNGGVNLEMTLLTARADGDWNSPVDWFDQGFTKDEREMQESCPNSENESGGICIEYDSTGACIQYESSQTNTTSGRTDIRCPYGSDNCSPVGC